jgi:hypothetical protein
MYVQYVGNGIIKYDTDSMTQTFFGQQRHDLLAEFMIACMLRRNTLFDMSLGREIDPAGCLV